MDKLGAFFVVAKDVMNLLKESKQEKKETSAQIEADDESFEVFILLKCIGEDFYVFNYKIAHHICLLKKSRDGKTYYTQLQTENGDMDGTVVIEFGEDYKFLQDRVFYLPVGRTCRSLEEMERFTRVNKFNGTPYNLLMNNCQHYVKDFIKFLDVYDKPEVKENPLTASNTFFANLIFDNISNVKQCTHYSRISLE
jgi:hypothetical protein